MSETRGQVRIEDCAKRIRAFLGGAAVVDTTGAKLVWEGPSYPAYYLPLADVGEGVLVASEETKRSPSRGDGRYFHVKAGDRLAENAALVYPESPLEQLRDLVRLEWGAMDAWFEEDEEVYVHPRSPYTRVDILPSSRRVRVELDGVVVAESAQPRILFETGLPPRYYLPLVDVRMDLLRPSATVTSCPYKGVASYWTIEVDGRRYDDVVWTYRTPLAESIRIAGLACFYNERVDLLVDGVLQPRPHTRWSSS